MQRYSLVQYSFNCRVWFPEKAIVATLDGIPVYVFRSFCSVVKVHSLIWSCLNFGYMLVQLTFRRKEKNGKAIVFINSHLPTCDWLPSHQCSTSAKPQTSLTNKMSTHPLVSMVVEREKKSFKEYVWSESPLLIPLPCKGKQCTSCQYSVNSSKKTPMLAWECLCASECVICHNTTFQSSLPIWFAINETFSATLFYFVSFLLTFPAHGLGCYSLRPQP